MEEVIQDMKELKFQLKILTGRDIEEEEIEKSVSETSDELDAFVPVSLDASSADDSMNVKESHIQKSESLLPIVTSVLQSGLTWREDSIKTFIDVLEHLSEFKNKCLEVVSTCLENYFLVGEKRREENEIMQHTFNAYDNIEESHVSLVCKDCLENVQFFNLEALNSIEFELDRLTNTIDLLQEEKNVIFNFCEKDFSYAIHKIGEEVKSMNSDLSYLLFMGSAEGSELLSNCKEVLRRGVNDRNDEIHNLTSDHDSWSPESEVLQVIAVCGKHLKSCLEKRQLETQKIQELLNLIEEESNMSSLLYSPALEAVLEANNAFIEFLVPETYTYSYVQKELESKDKRLIEASQALYCSMLETFKIERESISSDIEYLQDMRTERAEITEIESNEITVNFSDLFLTTFALKKAELERDVHKKLIVGDVNKKKADISAAEKDASNNVTKEENTEVNLSGEEVSIQEINETEKELKPFLQFDNYFEVRKQENRLKMDKKVIKEFLDLEIKLNAKVVETDIKSPSTLEAKSETVPEPDEDTEAFVNRVYEIKVQQIENEIILKRAKIGNVIKQRKYIMKNLIKSKKEEMEESVIMKEKQMQQMLDVVKSEDSQVICSLKDIFIDVVELKNKEKRTLKNKKELEKYLDEKLEAKKVFVNLDTIFNAVLGVKEEELEMLKRSKFKEIEKLVKAMRREVKKRIVIAYDKLETALRKYRQYEKARALEYAGISTEQKGPEREEYSIPDEDIFPDIKSFKDFISTFKPPFGTELKKSISIFKDVTPKADELKPYIPFIRPHAYAMHGLAGHILKLYEGELQALSKVFYDLKNETESAIQHGISFIHEETPSNEETVNAAGKEIIFEMAAVLNTNTSVLVLGSYLDANCEIALNLRGNFGLAYFEDILKIGKWQCHQPNVQKVSIDTGIDKFGNDDCLNLIATEFDKNVSSVLLSCSKFETLIGDYGLLELIRCIFLELHHRHLLCRKCGMENMFDSIGLSFDDVHKFLGSKTNSDLRLALPVTSGKPSFDDASVALYVCKLVLLRGALLTSVCLTPVLERLKKDKVCIISNSHFIQECSEYQSYVKAFISAFVPEVKVNFIFSKSTSCAMGAAVAAYMASSQKRNNPDTYLNELKGRIQENNKLFSVQNFLKALENPELYAEAFILAKCYLEHLEFDVPLSVIWGFNFLNENFEEAEEILKIHPVSLSQVNSMICDKIRSTENFDLSQKYSEFLKKNCDDLKVKIKAYRCIFELLVNKNLYEEAMKVIEEFKDLKIPLSNLPMSSLKVVHNYCVKNLEKNESVPKFVLPLKETCHCSSDSDLE